MKKEFISYDLALRMKQLGFDEPCFAFYQIEYNEDIPVMVDDNDQYRISGFRTCKNSEIPNHYTAVPTFSQVFKWFRHKNYKISISFDVDINTGETLYEYEIFEDKQFMFETDFIYKEYEDAELDCLEKLIEIVESK
jgi:hypothetical protein